MTQKEIIEVIDAVSNIQDNIYELTNCEYYHVLFHTNGYFSYVTFLDITIWDTEDEDDREYVETNNGSEGYYAETIEQYFLRKIQEEIMKFAKIGKKEKKK